MPLYLKIIICSAVCLILGISSGFILGSPSSSWYLNLNKPFFQPPAWVFGPAWTVLYTLMGISVALIWNNDIDESKKRRALWFFGIQLILNLIWTPIFFGLQMPGVALLIILALWLMILFTIWEFYKIKRLSSWLLVPYLAWIMFATALNASIVYLN